MIGGHPITQIPFLPLLLLKNKNKKVPFSIILNHFLFLIHLKKEEHVHLCEKRT